MNATLEQIAGLAQGVISVGNPGQSVKGFNTIDAAVPGDITFLGNPRYLPRLKKSLASAVLVPPGFADASSSMAMIEVENPMQAFQFIIEHFSPAKFQVPCGIHATASIGAGVKCDPARVFVGPCAVIEDGVEIAEGCEIHAGAFVGRGSRLGLGCVIHSNVSINCGSILGSRVCIHSGSVIGSDGFGYELKGGRHMKVAQMGIVQIDDDVEIGSCTTIDRARFGRTWIGEGTKIDNLVQIAHNCTIGKHCIICAHVGIAGSTRLGDYVVLAGQVGVAGHLIIGSQVTILAKSGVTKDCLEPGSYTGFPTKPLMEGRRLLASPAKVPEIIQRLRALEKRVEKMGGDSPPGV